jgi:hypothetical protein
MVPYIEFSELRAFHLDRAWPNTSPEEEALSFLHLVYIVRSYLNHGYGRPIIVTDFTDERLVAAAGSFSDLTYIILTLTASDEIIAQRVRDRNSGFTNIQEAVEWNREVKNRPPVCRELRLDNSTMDAGQTVDAALNLVRAVALQLPNVADAGRRA